MNGKTSGGAVAISLKYSLTIGKEPTDNVKVGTWLESPEKPSELVVKIRDNFKTLNEIFGQIALDIKKLKSGSEADYPDRMTKLDDALKELSSRKVDKDTTQRNTMLKNIAERTTEAEELLADITESIRIGNLIKPVITVGGPVRLPAGMPVTPDQLGAHIEPKLPLKLFDQGQEIGSAGFQTEGKRIVRVASDRTTTHDSAVGEVEVDVYIIKPVITVGANVSVPVRTPITLDLLGASVSDNLTLKIMGSKGEIDLAGFATPGERTLLVVCEPPAPNERAQESIKVKVVNQTREITFKPLTASITWGTPVTRDLLQAEATGQSAPVEIEEPSGGPSIGPNIYTLHATGSKKEWWNDATPVTATVTFHKIPREITWKLPKSLAGNLEVTPAMLGAELWNNEVKGKIKSSAEITVELPADGVLAALGKQITITLKAEESDYHAEATISGKIEVTKSKPKLAWSKPAPASLNDQGKLKLGPAQQNAVVTPANFATAPAYTPAPGVEITKAGLHRLDAKLEATPSSDAAEASVVLTIVKNATALRGMKEMNSGEAFVKPTKPKQGEVSDGTFERWEEWEKSDLTDPNAVGTQGKRILKEISLMKPAELFNYMKKLKSDDDNLPEEDRKVSAWRDEHGKKLISFKNGLELRYKPNGDKHTGGKPCYCLEVRKNPGLAEAGGQPNIAFKITADGKPAAKGPGQLQYPYLLKQEAQLDYKDGAMASTHLRLL